jgi:hypothetical protein
MKFISISPGVASIINKLNGLPFDENDEQLFEVSSQYSFCPQSFGVWPQRGTIIWCTVVVNSVFIYSNYQHRSADSTSAIKETRMMM